MSTSGGQHHGTFVGVKDDYPLLPAAHHHLAQAGFVIKIGIAWWNHAKAILHNDFLEPDR